MAIPVLSQISQAFRGIGNPLDWGKNPIDPSNARLQGGDWMREYMRGQLGGVGSRQAPQVGGAQVASGPQGQFRNQQQQLAGQLQGVASGQQMGAGEMAVRRQMQQAMAQQVAQSRMARGGNAAIAARAGARAMGDLGVNAAGQSAQAAMGDQAQARGLLAGVLGQGREQDIGLASQNAQLQQQAALANQAAKLQQMGMNDEQIARLLGQMYGVDAAEMQGQLGLMQGNQQQTGIFGDLLQTGGTLGGAAIMYSDRRLKTEIRDASREVDDMLDTLAPASFRYKDERHGRGQWAGIMAQDAERSRLGREFVREAADGKAIDGAKVISALLASVGRLNRRLRDVEGK